MIIDYYFREILCVRNYHKGTASRFSLLTGNLETLTVIYILIEALSIKVCTDFHFASFNSLCN